MRQPQPGSGARIPAPPHNQSFPETISDQLDRLEVLVGRIGMNSAEQAEALLIGLDRVVARIADLPAGGSRDSLEIELASMRARLQAEANAFLRDIGGAQTLRVRREHAKPPPENQWWFLDEHLQQQRRRQLQRGLIRLAAAVAVLALAIVIYQKFLAPDPQITALYRHQSAAQDAMIDGDWQTALRETELGRAIDPREPGLMVLQGVLLEQLRRQPEAEQRFVDARSILREPGDFWIERSQVYLYANQPERALQDAQQAVAEAPEKSQAYILIGQAYEVLQRYPEALDAYDQAFTQAEASNQSDIAAMARLRSAMLMRMLGGEVAGTLPALTPAP